MTLLALAAGCETHRGEDVDDSGHPTETSCEVSTGARVFTCLGPDPTPSFDTGLAIRFEGVVQDAGTEDYPADECASWRSLPTTGESESDALEKWWISFERYDESVYSGVELPFPFDAPQIGERFRLAARDDWPWGTRLYHFVTDARELWVSSAKDPFAVFEPPEGYTVELAAEPECEVRSQDEDGCWSVARSLVVNFSGPEEAIGLAPGESGIVDGYSATVIEAWLAYQETCGDAEITVLVLAMWR